MSRISKWKLEKTKVKVVFRLQFHATHIPQTGWDKLFISFTPADTGKPTAKTTKANVRNGSCKWGDPIYETTRLLQDSKTKQYDEKLYKLVISMGSSRASNLGEATINLADYVDASKPTIATFPLQGCSFGTILHITVQLLTSKTGFREFEQQRELREKGLQSGADSHGDGVSGRLPSSEGVTNDQIHKVSARIKARADASEPSSLEEEVTVNEEYTGSATGFYGSSNTFGDLYGLSHFQSLSAAKEDLSDHQSTAQSSTDSTHGRGSNNSTDNELAMASGNSRLRGSLEFAESSLFNLKLEISSLQGVADELGAETLKLSHELAAEISSAEELAKELLSMKSECLKFKEDIIELKELKLSPRIPRTEAQFLNGISVVEGKIRELQKMIVVPHDGNAKFIHLELEALLDFLLGFKLGIGGKTDLKKIRETSQFKDEKFESGNGFSLDLCPPESVLQHLISGPPLSDMGSVDAMKGQIFDLVRELDGARVEKEALNRKMDQMECYYEALIHELEENQKRMLEEMQLVRNEHSTCLYALSVSKSEVESLHEKMNQKMLQSVQEMRDLEAINVELEKRAATSEAALRRARLNNLIAVEKLQKDLELLSSQVTSMFESNENLIKQALPSQPVSGDADVAKSTQLSNPNLGLRKRSAGGDILLEDLKRSVFVQENLYRKVEEELVETYSINLNLDIYSKVLEESLCEAIEELTSSTVSQNHLMLRLKKATDEMHALNEYKSSSISECSEMALQNRLLEDKLSSVSEENYLLSQKLIDLECTSSKLRSCQSKYAVCSAQNAELLLRLEQEDLENEKLKTEMSDLKVESDELVSSKRNLDESIKFVLDKLGNQLLLYNNQFGIISASQSLNLENVDIKDAVLQLEEVLHSAYMKNCRLMEDNWNLKSEKAEILSMKEKFKSGLIDIVTKIDVSNALVDRLQDEIESVANKVYLSSEIEEKFAEQNEVLLADFALLEDQIQRLTCKISNLDSFAEELARNKLEIAELMHDRQQLTLCLTDKSLESMKLAHEVNILNEDLKTLRDKLRDEKALKDELEQEVQHLTLCLSKEQEKSRLVHHLPKQNELLEELKKDRLYQASFESYLSYMHDYSLSTDVQLIYVSNQYKAVLGELLQKLALSEMSLRDLQRRYRDTKSGSLASEDNWRREKNSLLASLESLRSNLEVSDAQNKFLSDSNNEIRDQLEESKRKLIMIETWFFEEEMSNLIQSKDELEVSVIVLKGKVDELSKKFSEQVMKTEEFKNLSVHLKELKDKAEPECVAAREKREIEVPSVAAQDSLRVAFLKEQYETKIQELKLKLSVSQKHGEEMLMRLQDSIDEIEERKKYEAVSLKRNEELSTRLAALEGELISALSERCEKAELECALLSLECCKEEKEKLEASLSEFEAEKSELAHELTLVKGQLEDLKSNLKMNGTTSDANDENLGSQKLRSSIERLHEELEKMKNENTNIDAEHDRDPDFHREITQLHKANEELRSMFPQFDETSSGGNALDRVLALEIELAEALKVKNKSNNLFQSSFLKQHRDDEAVFKSFRDINELIKEMLELKQRHVAVEAELREMHEKYSRLSLQFAEVEGERQKLKMTLKSVRASKR